MRPNIEISHTLNGRVKDYAAAHDLDVSEAYREIIEAGLAAVERDGVSNGQPDTSTADGHDHGHEENETPASVDAVLAEWEPQSGPADRGRQLVRQAVTALRANGWLTRQELWAEIDSDVSERTTMERNVMPGLAALREAGLVETEREGFETAHHRWVGD